VIAPYCDNRFAGFGSARSVNEYCWLGTTTAHSSAALLPRYGHRWAVMWYWGLQCRTARVRLKAPAGTDPIVAVGNETYRNRFD
jgi:hypothetical protein